jgi:hypothetical protein
MLFKPFKTTFFAHTALVTDTIFIMITSKSWPTIIPFTAWSSTFRTFGAMASVKRRISKARHTCGEYGYGKG